MSANFTPVYKDTAEGRLFRFWCQKVLPLVYDDSLSYYELLCKVVNYLNEVIKNADTVEENVRALYNAFVHLQEHVNNFFESLDVDEVVVQEFNRLVDSGYFGRLLFGYHTYKEFGAVMDGVTNDYAAVKACHDAANADGLPVINFGGSVYIGGTGIDVKTDCHFYGTKIIVDGNSGDYVFNVPHDSTGLVENVTLNSVFSSEVLVANAYKHKFFVVDTQLSLGARMGTGVEGFVSLPCVADDKGNCRFPMPGYADLDGQVVSVRSISPANERGIIFGGCSVHSKGNVTPCFVKVNRNNCLVENIYIEYTAENSANFGAVILVYESCNTRVNNITSNYSCPVYSYAVCVWRSYNTVVSDLKGSEGGWASFASNTTNNLYFRNCKAERFDNHENQYGVCSIEDCDIEYGSLGFGYGKAIFSKSNILKGVNYRQDYGLFYMGDVDIVRCVGTTIYNDDRQQGGEVSPNIPTKGSHILIDSCVADYATYEGRRTGVPDNIITVRNMKTSTRYYNQSLPNNRYIFENCEIGTVKGLAAVKMFNCKANINDTRSSSCEHEYHNCVVSFGWNPAVLKVRAYNTEFKAITNNNNIACIIANNCRGVLPITGVYVGILGGKFNGYSGYTNSSRGGYIMDCFVDAQTYTSMINNNTAPARINLTDGAQVSGFVGGTNGQVAEPTFELLPTF